MSSYDYGKPEVCAWIRQHFPPDATILDVGACDGKWRRLLPEYPNMDALEAWLPNFDALRAKGYRTVILDDIRSFRYEHYDLVILGDILEHLAVNEAQAVLEYAAPRSRDMIIAVPFLYKQGAIYGNPYEVHVQPDLTPENFDERYPGFEVLLRARDNYCYYHKGAET
ncbi:MAG: class I SAM-dependent methyltransferase [Candidatus Faecousia sp.]|nr:class I SAM-dependent methyltransferase [Candidatus Faecousia sp.]